MHRRQLLQYLVAASTVCSMGGAMAQDFPTKPIRILVASAPGALTDSLTRLYAERMSSFLKQPVVVENLAGASSLLASRQLLKSEPDGYTLMTSANTMVTVPLLRSNAGYEVKDFTPIGEMARSPAILVVSSASPFKSLNDIVAAAKKNPGQVSFGSGGVGTTNHLPVELFAKQAGISLTHVPYKGIALAVPDVSAGRVSFMIGTPTSLVELIKNGSLRPLAITSETRSAKFPDLPTFKELGWADGTFEIWIGMVAPGDMPAAVKAKLAQAMEAARKDPALVSRLEAAGQSISNVRTPQQFEAMMRSEEEKFRKVIREANIAVQ
ncbi:MAG TPA: tripartite tricarboxylate transporter substrate binding protein [Ramlibacter sp.]|nr:tripartite tricarboxylate transporter substrate binding protein [Ramlibacter sp.]